MASIQYHVNDVIPFTFDAWIIVLSCFVSFLGSATTVELLHRRQTRRGLMCQFHLCLSAVCFGLVAIWCMHFVGNKAIVMGDGRHDIQLSYSPGYTALSAVLPVLGLYLGFSTVDRYGKSKQFLHPSLVVTGLTAGLSIMAMHYVGNLGTSNYHLQHNRKNIIGAAAIAVFDCWFSFTIFFHLRERWMDDWWLRLPCSVLLAAAVSGMHWTAATGTTYRLKVEHVLDRDTQDLNVILACVLCAIALLSCMSLLYWTTMRQRKLAKRAHQVVLAALVRDEHGQVLVTQEGLLPSRTITEELYFASPGRLDKSHPLFHWMYRISNNWGAIAMLIPKMRDYLTPTADTGEPNLDLLTFRARFCVAAQELANDLGVRLHDLGVLHTEIIATGEERSSNSGTNHDIESIRSTKLGGKGQTLLICRNVDQQRAQDLITLGFRFAALQSPSERSHRVLDIMSAKMQAGKLELMESMKIPRSMSSTSTLVGLNTSPEASSHYMALFALRPRIGTTTCPWDILVYKADLSMIPIVTHDTNRFIDAGLRTVLKRFSGKRIDVICDLLARSTDNCGLPEAAYTSLYQWMENTLHTFRNHIPSSIYQNAVFCPTPVTVPVNTPANGEKAHATIWSFAVILDVHNLCNLPDNNDLWSWIPFNFFQCLQLTKRSSSDQAALAQKSYIEFSTLVSKALRPETSSLGKQKTLNRLHKKIARAHARLPSVATMSSRTAAASARPDNCSEKGLMSSTTMEVDPQSSSAQSISFGGILVSQEVSQSDTSMDPNIELQDLGLKSTAGVVKEEESTWADDLYTVSVRQWLLNKPGQSEN